MTSPDTSLVADSGSKPKIGLEDLPQELKDQIYGYSIGACDCTYHADNNYYASVIKHPGASELSRHALFKTSKRVRNEAMEVCFSKVEFSWSVRCEYCWDDACRSLSFSANGLLNYLPIDRLMNVSLVFDMWENLYMWDDSSWWYLKDSNVRCDLPKVFGGADILRKRMRIVFEMCSASTHRIISTTYFEGLTTLTGFQTMLVQISMAEDNGKEKLSDCEHLQTAMKDALEPALGPAIMGSAKLNEWGYCDCFLEFRPRQHSTKLLGNKTAGAVGHPRQDLCGFRPDAEFPRQIKTEATCARDCPRSRAETKAHSASLRKESETCSSDDVGLELNSLMQSSSIDEAGW